jgi:hypothetical protein
MKEILLGMQNAKFKMQKDRRVRNKGVKSAAAFTPCLQTVSSLHFEFCLLNYSEDAF